MEALRALSADESVRRLADARDKALSNFNSAVSSAQKKGIVIGERRGERRGRETVALNMLRANMSVEAVVEITGLPLGRVKTLASGLLN